MVSSVLGKCFFCVSRGLHMMRSRYALQVLKWEPRFYEMMSHDHFPPQSATHTRPTPCSSSSSLSAKPRSLTPLHSHVGESDITNFILLSRARQSLKVPFIASGGFADGQGLAAALCLGACGINMGTRFMCTVEAPIHNNIKEEIVRAQETDTALVLRRWKNTTRLYRNKVTDQALKVEQESTSGEFAEIAPFVSGARGRQVFINGDPEYGVSEFQFPRFCEWS